MRRMSTAGVCILLVAAGALGCGGSIYPEAKVQRAEGAPGKCTECGKALPLVGEEHMVTIGASRFVVCDEKCGAKLSEKLKNQ